MLNVPFSSFLVLLILTTTNIMAMYSPARPAATAYDITDPIPVLTGKDLEQALDSIISKYGNYVTTTKIENLFISIRLCLAKAANSYLPLCTRRSEHNKAHQLLLDLNCCKELITLEEFINFTRLINELRATKQAIEQLVSLNPSLLDPLHRR
jgi:hypothetical protein